MALAAARLVLPAAQLVHAGFGVTAVPAAANVPMAHASHVFPP